MKGVNEQKKKLLDDLLQELHQNKRLTLFNDSETNEIFLYFQDGTQDDIESLLIKIQFVLGGDFSSQNSKENSFYTIYQLSKDWQQIRDEFSKKEDNRVYIQKKELPVVSQKHFTTALLTLLEKNLSQSDISPLIRRQSVCAVVGGSRPTELFENIYVSVPDLKKALCPDVDVFESPWLFDKLMETVDKRMLENVSQHDSGSFRKNFSIDICVSTLLTKDFEKFNSGLDPKLKSSVLLEIKQRDIFSNLSAFLAAKSYIISEGFRFCIDAVTADSLAFINREKLGASFIKLKWDENLLAENEAFSKALQDNNPANIILYDVDSAKAIDWGQKQEINIFQGYYVQKLLYQNPKTHRN